jgi:hypothetical protein
MNLLTKPITYRRVLFIGNAQNRTTQGQKADWWLPMLEEGNRK